MNIVLFVFELLLLLWFFGCIVTYRVGKAVLVEGMGVRSAEFVMLVLYSAAVLVSVPWPWFGRWLVLSILVFWLVVQFRFHWYYTIFGASDAKIKGYNRCFRNTVRLLLPREDRLIPDFYHIMLHTLILVNIVLSVIDLFCEK